MVLHRRAMLRSALAGFGALTTARWARADDGEEPTGTILAVVHMDPHSEKPGFMFNGLIAIDPKSGAWRRVSERIGGARLSPDGKRLAQAQVVARPKDHGLDASLWVGDLDGKEPLRKVFKPDEGRVSHPIWSADGRSILVGMLWGTPAAPKSKAIRLAPDGSDVQEVALFRDCLVMDCSKDGRMLALVWGDPPRDPKTSRLRQSLVLLGPDGKEVRRIVDDEAGTVARFSPDGSRLLLTTKSSDGFDLWIEPVEGGDRTRIEMTSIRHVDACWSPDGKHLAVSRYNLTRRPNGHIGLDLNRGPLDSRLEVVSADGQERRTLPLLDGVFSVCDWR